MSGRETFPGFDCRPEDDCDKFGVTFVGWIGGAGVVPEKDEIGDWFGWVPLPQGQGSVVYTIRYKIIADNQYKDIIGGKEP